MIFKASDIKKSELDEVVKEAKEEMTEVFGEVFWRENGKLAARAGAFLKTYLQIHFLIADEDMVGSEHCILKLSPYLDALELMKSFPVSDEGNPFRRMMAGKGESKSYWVKESGLFRSVEAENPLLSKRTPGRAFVISRRLRRAVRKGIWTPNI